MLGNPLDLYLADRHQTVADQRLVAGAVPEARLGPAAGRARGRQPDHLVVDDFSDAIMRDDSPETRALIAISTTRSAGPGPTAGTSSADAPRRRSGRNSVRPLLHGHGGDNGVCAVEQISLD